MINEEDHEALVRRVGVRARITRAVDLEDNWRERFARLSKPGVVVQSVVVMVLTVLLFLIVIALSGREIVPSSSVRLARTVEDLVPDAEGLGASLLRARLGGLQRSLEFVDRVIVPPVKPSDYGWFARIFGRPAPQLEPGRAAALAELIDKVISYPPDRRSDMIDNIVSWASASATAETVVLLRLLGNLPADIRQAMLATNASQLRETINWLLERRAKERDIHTLSSAVEGHRLELADQLAMLKSRSASMMLELERRRDQGSICARYIRDFDDCLTPRTPRTGLGPKPR